MDGNNIARLTTAGSASEYPVPSAGSDSFDIVTGSDGALWFTEFSGGKIGRVAVAQPDGFFAGQQAVSSTFEYLQFPDGNVFGYYAFLQGSASAPNAFLYHSEMGYEYVTPGSAAGAVYFYDFGSQHWWFTSSSLFPEIYDFTLGAWIYYFPDAQNPGHYSSNPRYFSNLSTGNIFTQ